MGKRHRIALISDTHGLLREELERNLGGVEEVLHAGDVGDRQVMERICRKAPLTAVRGNMDAGLPSLPLFAFRSFGGFRVLLTHFLGPVERPLPQVLTLVETHRPHLLLFGHTHLPWIGRLGSQILVNPGSCGPFRFRLPCSFGFLEVEEGGGKEAGGQAEIRIFELFQGQEIAHLTEPF